MHIETTVKTPVKVCVKEAASSVLYSPGCHSCLRGGGRLESCWLNSSMADMCIYICELLLLIQFFYPVFSISGVSSPFLFIFGGQIIHFANILHIFILINTKHSFCKKKISSRTWFVVGKKQTIHVKVSEAETSPHCVIRITIIQKNSRAFLNGGSEALFL